MERYRQKLGIAGAVGMLLAGCAASATTSAGEPDLAAMEDHGCGYGFWLGSPDGQVAVRLAADHELAASGQLPGDATLPDAAWQATVLVGEDLYANWCDDVIEVGEPEPVVLEEWPVTAGTIAFQGAVPAPDCPTEARATVTGLTATRADGTTVQLGDRELHNDAWGCFAG